MFEEGAVSDVQLHDEPNNLYFALTLHCFDKLFTKLPTTGKSYTLLGNVDSAGQADKVGMSRCRFPFNFSGSTFLKITKRLNLHPFKCAI